MGCVTTDFLLQGVLTWAALHEEEEGILLLITIWLPMRMLTRKDPVLRKRTFTKSKLCSSAKCGKWIVPCSRASRCATSCLLDPQEMAHRNSDRILDWPRMRGLWRLWEDTITAWESCLACQSPVKANNTVQGQVHKASGPLYSQQTEHGGPLILPVMFLWLLIAVDLSLGFT